MVEIKKARPTDLEKINSLLGRLALSDEIDISTYLHEKISSYIESEHLLLIKDGSTILGCLFYSHDIKSNLNLNTKDFYNLLDELEIQDEPLVGIDFFFVDVLHRNKGYATTLLNSLISLHKNSTFFIKKPANLRYNIEKLKFLPTFKIEQIYVRKYVESGLCKNVKW